MSAPLTFPQKVGSGLCSLGLVALLVWGMQACTLALATPEDKARWAKGDQDRAARREQKIKDPRSQFEYRVCKAAQEHMRDTLLAPSTADFPRCPSEGREVASYKGHGHYEVFSYVDAQNAFGAMIRTKYWAEVDIAEVDADGNIAKWNIHDFGVAK